MRCIHQKATLFFYSARVHWRWHLAKSSLFFFITGVRCGFCAGLWDFCPNSLLRRLDTVLERIAVPFKRKIAWIFLQKLFGERITICHIEQSSFGHCLLWITRPFPVTKRAIRIWWQQCPFLCILLHVNNYLCPLNLCQRRFCAHCMDVEMT